MSFRNGSTGRLEEDISASVLSITGMVSLISFTFKGSHPLVDGCCSCNGREGSSTGNTLSSSRVSAIIVRESSSLLVLADCLFYRRLKLAGSSEKTQSALELPSTD